MSRKTTLKVVGSEGFKNQITKISCECFTIPLYNLELHVGVSKQLAVQGVAYPAVNGVIDILFSNNKPAQGTIAHECSHAVDFVGKDIGQQLTDECRAYLMGFLVEEVNKALKKMRKK